jgi:hypothetical protein
MTEWRSSCEGCPYPDTCGWFHRCVFRGGRDEPPPYERPLDDDRTDPNLEPPPSWSRAGMRERLGVNGDRDE